MKELYDLRHIRWQIECARNSNNPRESAAYANTAIAMLLYNTLLESP